MQYQVKEQPRGPFEGADEVMTTKVAAKYVGYTVRTLQCWRAERKGPPYCRPSGAVRYLKADLIRWLTSHRVSVETEAAMQGMRAGMRLTGGEMR
jgi:Helix-turn-helix domain